MATGVRLHVKSKLRRSAYVAMVVLMQKRCVTMEISSTTTGVTLLALLNSVAMGNANFKSTVHFVLKIVANAIWSAATESLKRAKCAMMAIPLITMAAVRNVRLKTTKPSISSALEFRQATRAAATLWRRSALKTLRSAPLRSSPSHV